MDGLTLYSTSTRVYPGTWIKWMARRRPRCDGIGAVLVPFLGSLASERFTRVDFVKILNLNYILYPGLPGYSVYSVGLCSG